MRDATAKEGGGEIHFEKTRLAIADFGNAARGPGEKAYRHFLKGSNCHKLTDRKETRGSSPTTIGIKFHQKPEQLPVHLKLFYKQGCLSQFFAYKVLHRFRIF